MKKKKEYYILYLITKEKDNLLKIGITRQSNLNSRVSNIEKDFGKINYKKSFICYSEDMKDIDNLEKLLHKTFYASRKQDKFKDGVGKTEWFDAKILDEVKNQIAFLRKKNKNFKDLSILKKMSEENKRKEKFLALYSKIHERTLLVLYISVLVSLSYLIYYK